MDGPVCRPPQPAVISLPNPIDKELREHLESLIIKVVATDCCISYPDSGDYMVTMGGSDMRSQQQQDLGGESTNGGGYDPYLPSIGRMGSEAELRIGVDTVVKEEIWPMIELALSGVEPCVRGLGRLIAQKTLAKIIPPYLSAARESVGRAIDGGCRDVDAIRCYAPPPGSPQAAATGAPLCIERLEREASSLERQVMEGMSIGEKEAREQGSMLIDMLTLGAGSGNGGFNPLCDEMDVYVDADDQLSDIGDTPDLDSLPLELGICRRGRGGSELGGSASSAFRIPPTLGGAKGREGDALLPHSVALSSIAALGQCIARENEEASAAFAAGLSRQGSYEATAGIEAMRNQPETSGGGRRGKAVQVASPPASSQRRENRWPMHGPKRNWQSGGNSKKNVAFMRIYWSSVFERGRGSYQPRRRRPAYLVLIAWRHARRRNVAL